jgi:hypothetical protein
MTVIPRSGLSNFFYNSVPFDVASDATWQPDQWVPVPYSGLTGAQGNGVEFQYGKIELTIRDANGLSIDDFAGATGIPVVLQQRNGKQVIGASMMVTDAIAVNVATGEIKLSLQGASVRESK